MISTGLYRKNVKFALTYPDREKGDSPYVRSSNMVGRAMIFALVLFSLDEGNTGDTKEKIRTKSLGNAKQLILNTSWPGQDQVLVDLAVDGTGEVLNVALAAFSDVPGVKGISVVHVTQQT
jgi:hypothetical protein